ncbi:MAG: thioredoxin domain-containing protein [Candidatus Cloacimonadales bacterium]|nr:thioredoxin domain-containing protein [Candidatus Cloacimonadales bacterium]
MNNISKIMIVVALIIVVAIVFIQKNKTEKLETPQEGEICDTILVVGDDLGKGLLPEMKTEPSQQQNELLGKQPVAEKNAEPKVVPFQTEKPVQTSQPKVEKDVLALVNGEEITKAYFDENFKNLPEQYKDMFKNNNDDYLDQLITKEVLIQKVVEKGYLKAGDNSQVEEDAAIQRLFGELGSDIEIPEAEMEQFYKENKGQMQEATFEQVKNDIRSYLVQQKQRELIEAYIKVLKNTAIIVLNEKWIAEQIADRPENPLTKVLGNGLPTVLDLGSSTCVPCKMMMPIFEELETELKGKANILLLQLADYRDIANEYQVRVIPTQIFFDQNGKQYWQHEGFFSKEDIMSKLKETGAEL